MTGLAPWMQMLNGKDENWEGTFPHIFIPFSQVLFHQHYTDNTILISQARLFSFLKEL